MILAHGVGSRGDLPLPLWQFAWAAVFALVFSFVALGAWWTEPRLAAGLARQRGASRTRIGAAAALVARVSSFALYLIVLSAGFVGADTPADNVAPVTIYVVAWVGLPLATAVLGDVWRVLSPFDTLAVIVERGRVGAPEPAPPWASWLAPFALFGFLFLELVHPSGSSPRVLATALAVVTVVIVAGTRRWGRAWARTADPFGALLRAIAAAAPLRFDSSGRGVVRGWPLSGLAVARFELPIVASLLVVAGGTTFDGLVESALWRDAFGRGDGWGDALVELAGLVAMIALVAGVFVGAVAMMRSSMHTDGVPDDSVGSLAARFAPSLVPIVVGYTVAHYAQLFVDEVQTFWFRLSDPYGRGWDLFGAADGTIDFTVLSPVSVAWIQVFGIVLGHVAAVVVAHDIALARFGREGASRSQHAMLGAMVCYSIGGLWLLLEG